ncbi:MAG: SEC-C domain-containing protein [Heliobacteriaceae bacterium]|nr:SEC-C domain-containing protein [Heliobacteriaceae bacterium]
MLVLDDLREINDVIKEIAGFIGRDSAVKPDFEEYLRTVGGSLNPEAAAFNYIFERSLDNKNIIELYLEKSKKLPAGHKKIVQALEQSISSVFEVKRILKNGFELYNIINEKTYYTTSLVKMTAFRGIGPGLLVVARIFNYEDTSYLLEISGVLPSRRREDALRYAVAKIIETPELVYFDNPEKQKEIEKNVNALYKKFVEYFGTDEVITTNKFADDVINLFNEYAETGYKASFSDKIQLPDGYRFFNVSEFNNSYDNFLENSLGGFSSHNEVYDVGVIFDKELGLYAIPFYGTFNKIFDGETVENADKCVEYFLNNDKFSANLLVRIAEKHANFMELVNKFLGAKYTLDELLQKYKSRYLKNKVFSSTTVLYKSEAFSNTLGLLEEQEERPEVQSVGRNEPCPCGSGAKYKKCCGAG